MTICFRMEGSHSIGMGHVMRCLTLARYLRARGHDVVFLCGRTTAKGLRASWPQARCVLLPEGLNEMQDAQRCRMALQRLRVDWLVVDHYGLGVAWERMMRTSAKRVLAIDDLARKHAADAVLDSALDGRARYRGKMMVGAAGLFGPAYALLRPGVAQARAAFTGEGKRVFVCFGGADPKDMTRRAVDVLSAGLPGVGGDVVVGFAYEGKDALQALCARQPGWVLHVNHPSPERLMVQAMLAIGAGGTMTCERCAVGVPSVVISIADNQREMSTALGHKRVLHYLGAAEKVTDATLLSMVKTLKADAMERKRLSRCSRALVDGRGAERVARVMRRLA